jgi:phenol/toluene 2-monooxygenase (NADH) P0/A0
MKETRAFLPEPVVCDIALKYVRVTEVRDDGLVMFEFSIGWPEQMVELVLPQPAFDEFCATHQVQHLPT